MALSYQCKAMHTPCARCCSSLINSEDVQRVVAPALIFIFKWHSHLVSAIADTVKD